MQKKEQWIYLTDNRNTMQERNWKEDALQAQRNLLNAACRDLSEQVKWHGNRLSLDDWRHLISGTVLGWRMMPAIDRGDGTAQGFIMLGGSSMDLNKSQCAQAIDMAFMIGDCPNGQGLDSQSVRWCKSVVGARWIA